MSIKRHLLPLFGLLAVIVYLTVLYKDTSQLAYKTREGNAYLRVVACISSVQHEEQTDEYIAACYEQAEKENELQLDRYGK